MHVGLNLCKYFAISYLSFTLRESTLKVEYLTPMTLSPESNESLAKALGRPIFSSSTSRASHTAWADHGPIVPLTFLSPFTFGMSGGLPTSTALRSMDHSCRGCEVSDVARYRLCVCPALNKGIPCEDFSQ